MAEKIVQIVSDVWHRNVYITLVWRLTLSPWELPRGFQPPLSGSWACSCHRQSWRRWIAPSGGCQESSWFWASGWVGGVDENYRQINYHLHMQLHNIIYQGYGKVFHNYKWIKLCLQLVEKYTCTCAIIYNTIENQEVTLSTLSCTRRKIRITVFLLKIRPF